MKTFKVEKTRKDRSSIIEGTLEELIKYFSYTLECGRSYNKKIKHKTEIKTINSLIKALEKSFDEVEGGYERTSLRLIK